MASIPSNGSLKALDKARKKFVPVGIGNGSGGNTDCRAASVGERPKPLKKGAMKPMHKPLS